MIDYQLSLRTSKDTSTQEMEIVCDSKMLLTISETAGSYNPKDHNLNFHHCGNLKPYEIMCSINVAFERKHNIFFCCLYSVLSPVTFSEQIFNYVLDQTLFY